MTPARASLPWWYPPPTQADHMAQDEPQVLQGIYRNILDKEIYLESHFDGKTP